MGPRLRRSLRRYLKTREARILANDGFFPLRYLFITEQGPRITEVIIRRRLSGWVKEDP